MSFYSRETGEIYFSPSSERSAEDVNQTFLHEFLHKILDEHTNIGKPNWFEQENLLTFFLEEAINPNSSKTLQEHLEDLEWWFQNQYGGKVKNDG